MDRSVTSSDLEDLRCEVEALRKENEKYKQAQEAISVRQLEVKQTLQFLEAVTKGTDVLIATVDKNYNFTYFNQAYKEELRRLSAKDIQIGMNLLEVFADLPELQRVVAQEWGQVMSGESTQKILEFGDPKIYRRIYNVLHTPIWDDEGNVVGAGEVDRNITEQMLVQAALDESETRYHSLFDSMTEGFAVHEMIFDEDGKPVDYRFLDINPAFERLTGLHRETVVGNTYRQVLSTEGDFWVNTYGKVVETGEAVQFEQYAATLGKYYEIFAYRSGHNQFATIFLDITERKRMEDDLRVNLTKYSILFHTFPLGVTITDKNGNIIETNTEASRLLGLSEEEQEQRKIDGEEWKIIQPDGSLFPTGEYPSVKALKEQCRVDNVEMGILKGNNEISWITVSAAPIPLENYGVVITYHDITPQIKAKEALRMAHEQLEATVQQRTRELLAQTEAVEAQRKRFNDVLEILPVYTVLLTADYHVSFANKYFRERFGEDLGRACYEYLFNRHEPCLICETYTVMKTGTSHHWEWTGPDGRIYDVHDFPFDDVDGSRLILELGIDITERKQAEEKLRQLNTYNRSLIEANVDALVTITSEGKIGDVNSVTEAITGRKREELVGTDFSGYFTDPQKARAGYQKVFEDGKVRDYELEIQHLDGHTTPVTYNASVYQDTNGQVGGVFAAARDITDRKRVEGQLTLLNAALESAANGIILADKDGTIIWSNPSFSHMTGYSREEIIGQNPRFLKSGKQEPEFYRNLWDTILAGEVWRGEIINRRKDGSLYYEEQTITPVFDRNRNIFNFISIRQDISEHKEAEEALRKSEQQYRSLVSASAQIVWQTNANGEVITDNPLYRGYTGQSLEESLGMGWLIPVHPADQERVSKIWAHAVETKTPYEAECRIKSHSGEYRDFSLRAVPIIENDGTISSWIGTSTDITDKKNYVNQLMQAEKHAVIGRMVGSVTHEINNPLQTIKNCLYLIQQETPPDSVNAEPLEMALSETTRLSNLVGQLRQLYRPRLTQGMQTHDLKDIIEEAHALVNPHLNSSRVIWYSSSELLSCQIKGNKEQLLEVFLNICMNAVEAMQPDGGELRVGMSFSDSRDRVGVIIKDTGPGISAEILPHIFEPFITTKEFGLGLGLSICYEIIQKHGGQIMVESQLGSGTTFTVWLPRLTPSGRMEK